MDFIDYYKVLEVDKTTTQEEIKKAYRRLARKLHPDLNPGDKDAHKKFQQINEANEVISDPEKRKKYDEFGKDWQHADAFKQQERDRNSHQSSQSSFTNEQDYSDSEFSGFFESMFGSSANRAQTKFRGQDFNATLHLSLEEAVQTHTRTLTINGKNIRITIPAGIEDQQTIKLKGHGAPGINGGPHGDLYITFQIATHTNFKRVGNDLYTTAIIDLYTALLGGQTTIDTLTGKVKLNVQAETQPGTKVRLKGKGFPVYKQDGKTGDLYVTYQIKLPTHLTDKQKELFSELSKLS